LTRGWLVVSHGRNARSRGLNGFAARWIALGCLTWLGCIEMSGGSAPRDVQRVAVSDGWLAMGTFFEADLRVEPEAVGEARAWLEWARLEIARLEKVYSRHDPESEVSAFNRELARPDVLLRPLRVGSTLEDLLFASIEVWEGSGGAFDITVGPLIDLFSQAASSGRWPSLDSLRRAKRRVGSGRLLLPGDGEVGVTALGMRVDLDGISKGAVLDRLRERLDERLPDAAALLSFGQSSILAIGNPDRRAATGGWRLEIQSRGARGERLGVVRLRDRALSVSSSVGSVSEIDGQRVSHVVDPRTGIAVAGTVEAVVVSDRAALADGWSTALLVLGADRNGIRLVERAGLQAIVYSEGGRVAHSEGWDALIDSDRPASRRGQESP